MVLQFSTVPRPYDAWCSFMLFGYMMFRYIAECFFINDSPILPLSSLYLPLPPRFLLQEQFEFVLTAVAEEVNVILKALPQ